MTVSGVDFANDLSGIAADPVQRPNVVYQIHPYPWVSEDWKSVIDQLLEHYPVLSESGLSAMNIRRPIQGTRIR